MNRRTAYTDHGPASVRRATLRRAEASMTGVRGETA
ncbi:hypothetical protein SNOUR_08870 [Streptomyces noursei ATCC 11455]|nr:hypothetical protein SNOUR_08870 [Streptomyces noursei ATCC 11455]